MLTILQVAYPLAPVGPDAVGGAEQVLHALDAALTRKGHRSLVVACAGSSAAGRLLATPAATGAIDQNAQKRAWAAHRGAIETALAREKVDLVHFHGVDFPEYLPARPVKMLATLHLPPDWYDARVWDLPLQLNCVSAHQHRVCPPQAGILPVVRNGIDLDRFAVGRKRLYALALGRICPEKGFDLALDAARMAEVPLALGGRVFPYEAHQRHFREAIVPRLDRRRRFLGAVGRRARRRLLANARCLLVPSRVEETSSLVAMEALASGTPVVAFARGALAELVDHGRTGFLVDSVEEMAAAIRAAGRIDPALCRHVAERRFAAPRMAADYLRLYGSIVGASPTVRTTGAPSPRSTIESEANAMSMR